MSLSDTPQPPSNKISGRTTPTWETELLLSGATVFALIQATQAFLGWDAYLMPRLDDNLRLIASLFFTYGHGALVLLVMAFILHLLLRAYWVALVGMHSVYPGGLRFDRISAGPLAKELLTRRWPDMDEAIERADNRATIVFGLGVAIALMLVPVSVTVISLFGLSLIVTSTVGRPDLTPWVFLAISATWFLPFTLAGLMDRYWGQHLKPGSWAHRVCMTTLSLYSRVGMSRDGNPLITLFSTNVGERRGSGIVLIAMVIAMLSRVAGLVMTRNDLGVGSYGAFPEPRRGMPSSTEGRHYASRHDKDSTPLVPYVPDMVVDGDYLPLVVPYVPGHFSHLLEHCDGAGPAQDKVGDEQRRRETLRACMDRGIEVSLDGRPVTEDPDWYTEPGHDLRGLMYMIPVLELARGRHELIVLPAPKPKLVEDDEEAAPGYRIPFWR